MTRASVITIEACCPVCRQPVVARETCSEYLPETVECILLEAGGCLTCSMSARFVERTVAKKGEAWTREHLGSLFATYERHLAQTQNPKPPRLRAALLNGSSCSLEA